MTNAHKPVLSILGLVTLLWLGYQTMLSSKTVTHVWPGPARTHWQGAELRAVDIWRSGNVTAYDLELRCQRLPLLKTHSTHYWPGPEWNGQVHWQAQQVTYQPHYPQGSKPQIQAVSLPKPWWLTWCHAS